MADSVEKVYEAVKELAIQYHFLPGQRVNEVELAGKLGVSRTPVREALNRLSSDGFMRFVPNRGFYSRDMSPEGVRELYELRAAIECAAFKLACERGSDAEIEATARIWEDRQALEDSPDWNEMARADEMFHLAVTRLAKNAQITSTLESVNLLVRFFRRIDLQSRQRREKTYREHREIIECLRRRDAVAGEAVLQRHITLSSVHAVEVTKEGLAHIFFGHEQVQ